jgi:hypothetical protein
MIVCYTRERGYKGSGVDRSLTLGKKYIVFGIDFRPNSLEYPTKLGLISDSDGTPCLFELNFFDVVNEEIPPDWVFTHLGDGYYRLCPKEFTGDFWDRFHDADTLAEEEFQEVRKKLEKFYGKK